MRKFCATSNETAWRHLALDVALRLNSLLAKSKVEFKKVTWRKVMEDAEWVFHEIAGLEGDQQTAIKGISVGEEGPRSGPTGVR